MYDFELVCINVGSFIIFVHVRNSSVVDDILLNVVYKWVTLDDLRGVLYVLGFYWVWLHLYLFLCLEPDLC